MSLGLPQALSGAAPVRGETCGQGHHLLISSEPLFGRTIVTCMGGEHCQILPRRRAVSMDPDRGRSRTWRAWSATERAQAVACRARGQTVRQIALALGRTDASVQHVLDKAGQRRGHPRGRCACGHGINRRHGRHGRRCGYCRDRR